MAFQVNRQWVRNGSRFRSLRLPVKCCKALAIIDFTSTMSNLGYAGQAYVNMQTGEVIIANRGTVGNVQNLISDAEISVGARQQAQIVADQFSAAALQVAQDQLSATDVQLSAVYTTGHSLGGAESMGQAAFLSSATNSDGSSVLPAGVKITNASFDAPGISSLSTTGDSSNYTSYNFSAQGDLVTCAANCLINNFMTSLQWKF